MDMAVETIMGMAKEAATMHEETDLGLTLDFNGQITLRRSMLWMWILEMCCASSHAKRDSELEWIWTLRLVNRTFEMDFWCHLWHTEWAKCSQQQGMEQQREQQCNRGCINGNVFGRYSAWQLKCLLLWCWWLLVWCLGMVRYLMIGTGTRWNGSRHLYSDNNKLELVGSGIWDDTESTIGRCCCDSV